MSLIRGDHIKKTAPHYLFYFFRITFTYSVTTVSNFSLMKLREFQALQMRMEK